MNQPVSGVTNTPFPIPVTSFIAALRALLAHRDKKVAAEVLSTGKVRVEHRDWDNWNGGTDSWGIDVQVPIVTYAKMDEKVRQEVEATIQKAMGELLRGYENDGAGCTYIKPIIGADLTLVKTDINNQGRGVPGKPAHIAYGNLRFRSHAEVRLFKALKAKKVTVAPLPVFAVNGGVHREPDFFIIQNGLMMLVEVDGPETHNETPVEAERRLAPFKDEGVIIERVSTAECESDADAEACAAHLLAKFDLARNRR
jgi:hypothetical protein